MTINAAPVRDVRHVRDAKGVCWFADGDGHVMARYEGSAASNFFEPVIAMNNAAVKRGKPLMIYIDGEHFDGYESEFREKWTRWFINNRQHLVHMHFLLRSPILKMGVNLISIAVAGLVKATTDRTVFEAALDAESRITYDALLASSGAPIGKLAARQAAASNR